MVFLPKYGWVVSLTLLIDHLMVVGPEKKTVQYSIHILGPPEGTVVGHSAQRLAGVGVHFILSNYVVISQLTVIQSYFSARVFFAHDAENKISYKGKM